MDGLHASNEARITAAIATDANQDGLGKSEKLGEYALPPSETGSDLDEMELQKLGYKPVLARGWGAFDNFACTFSALYCVGVVRVLFYIAISNGGPAAL